MASKLDPSQLLKSESHVDLLNVIDQLRDLEMSHEISLPQLIVCGDQSAGKSSVLEAISNIKFPVASRACTRFATEVILRRNSEVTTDIKVRAGPTASEERKTMLASIVKPELKSGIQGEQIGTIIRDVQSQMGLGEDSGFCDDVLQIRIEGPQQPNLTLVDLPGLFHSDESLGQPQDAMVRDLVEQYMRGERTIILAIVTAKNDAANQLVLKLVKQSDPKSLRTLGVITKPDSLERNSDMEREFLRYARNEKPNFQFDLGWHVVRNGGDAERKRDNFERDASEAEFFTRAPWNQLAPSNLGAKSLRARLVKRVSEFVRSELPGVIVEIEDLMRKCEAEKDKLGPYRPTSDDQRVYLLEKSKQYRNIVHAALNGPYTDPYFSAKSRKLRAEVRRFDDDFAFDMRNRGHKYQVSGSHITPPRLAHTFQPLLISRSDMLRKVELHLGEGRGQELPTSYDPRLVTPVFREQSQAWGPIARTYGQTVWEKVRRFLQELMMFIWEKETCHALLRHVIEPDMDARWKKLEEKLDELQKPYKHGQLKILNSAFTQTVVSKRKNNIESEKEQQPSNGRIASIDILSQMEAFYEISLETFIDNVATLAVEGCVLDGLEDIMDQQNIGKMNETELARLAAESTDSKVHRLHLERKLKNIQTALDKCREQQKLKPATAFFLNPSESVLRAETPLGNSVPLFNIDSEDLLKPVTAKQSSKTPDRPKSTSPSLSSFNFAQEPPGHTQPSNRSLFANLGQGSTPLPIRGLFANVGQAPSPSPTKVSSADVSQTSPPSQIRSLFANVGQGSSPSPNKSSGVSSDNDTLGHSPSDEAFESGYSERVADPRRPKKPRVIDDLAGKMNDSSQDVEAADKNCGVYSEALQRFGNRETDLSNARILSTAKALANRGLVGRVSSFQVVPAASTWRLDDRRARYVLDLAPACFPEFYEPHRPDLEKQVFMMTLPPLVQGKVSSEEMRLTDYEVMRSVEMSKWF